MEAEFWHDRWRENRIGFHLEAVNPLLHRHWPSMELPATARVLVPLCGKSVDLAWLRERGHDVVGIELSPLAVEAFFAEHGLTPRREPAGALERWHAPGITLYCGDFFALDTNLLGRVDALYDRAALIALPPNMRPRYMAHLAALAPPGSTGLLVTFDYEQSRMAGPPFAVSAREARELAAQRWELTPLGEVQDALATNPRFAEAGLSRLEEQAWRLDRLA